MKYELMSKANKRIEVAKDVLKYLRAGTILAKSTYCEFRFDFDKIKPDAQLNKIIKKEEINCEACAVGSLMFSRIMKENNFKVSELNDMTGISQNKIFSRLKDLFGFKQLDMIETAYEGSIVTNKSRCLRTHTVQQMPTKIAEKCFDYSDSIYPHKEKLEAIMNNIIDNKGFFVP